MELPDVALPDAQSEDLNATFPQSCRHRPRVSAVGVAVGDEENYLGGIATGVTKDLLSKKNTYIFQEFNKKFISLLLHVAKL